MVSVPVEWQEGHHVVSTIVSDWSVRVGILGWRWSVSPEPLLIKTFRENRRQYAAVKENFKGF